MLYQQHMTGEAFDTVAQDFWRLRETTDETRARAEALARGTLRARVEVDAQIEQAALRWRPERLALVDRSILRLGAYELMHERQTPAAVVLDEAVELAKRFGESDSSAFVNGVLDAVRRALRGEAPEPGAPPHPAGEEPR